MFLLLLVIIMSYFAPTPATGRIRTVAFANDCGRLVEGD